MSIFLKSGVIGVALNNDIINRLIKIKEIAELNDLILLEGNINENNLYEINNNPSKYHKHSSIYQGHYGEAGSSLALAAFYQTAEFQTISEQVRFFHETWGHPSRDQMCWIVKHEVFKNIPATLTERAIRNGFLIVKLVQQLIWPSSLCLVL